MSTAGSAWEAIVAVLDGIGAPVVDDGTGLSAEGRAQRIAAGAHRRQVDKIGVPDIEHPAMVAALAQRLPAFKDLPSSAEREDVVVAAWLHDVVEDTGELAESLRAAGVSDRAVELVLALTRRDDVTPDLYYSLLADNRLAALVKAADIASNLAPERMRELPAATRASLADSYTKALTAFGVSRAIVEALYQDPTA